MKLSFSIVSLCLAFCLFSGEAIADELRLRDGRVIQADEVWETTDIVWYRQGKVIASVAKVEVVRMTRQVVEESATPESSTEKSTSVAEEKKTSTGAKRKVTRLWLKDGAVIDADSAWEESGRIVYRLGQMQTHVERAAVAKLAVGIEVTDAAPVAAVAGDVSLRFSTGNRNLDGLIVYNATRYGVDPMLIYLVMREESGFNYRAVSRVGARGLMQLMPATAARLGVRNIHDPVENVGAGTRYLRSLIDMFGGDINLALAGYNAGEGAVIKYGRRIPPYRETVNYVWRINTAYRRAAGQ
ncbi:MAG: lytic transglycosylase domain-containing protein [Acidobacteriota bacterium]|nr:lytic transglycosylase domain-containing protein [Acidobacteriota bacterium]